MHGVYRISLLPVALIFVIACSDGDPTGPTLSTVAGTYDATTFTVQGDDILAAGASLTLVLGEGGAVGGNLLVPATAGGPLDADMTGTWTLVGDSISITQAADTFVRDADWRWAGGVLEGRFEESVSVRMQQR